MNYKGLASVAAVALIIWIVVGLVFKVVGAAIHLLLFAAVVLGVISLVQRVRKSRKRT
jgi:hypothetical protein